MKYFILFLFSFICSLSYSQVIWEAKASSREKIGDTIIYRVELRATNANDTYLPIWLNEDTAFRKSSITFMVLDGGSVMWEPEVNNKYVTAQGTFRVPGTKNGIRSVTAQSFRFVLKTFYTRSIKMKVDIRCYPRKSASSKTGLQITGMTFVLSPDRNDIILIPGHTVTDANGLKDL